MRKAFYVALSFVILCSGCASLRLENDELIDVVVSNPSQKEIYDNVLVSYDVFQHLKSNRKVGIVQRNRMAEIGSCNSVDYADMIENAFMSTQNRRAFVSRNFDGTANGKEEYLIRFVMFRDTMSVQECIQFCGGCISILTLMMVPMNESWQIKTIVINRRTGYKRVMHDVGYYKMGGLIVPLNLIGITDKYEDKTRRDWKSDVFYSQLVRLLEDEKKEMAH